ncbi:MAG: glycosyltransferase family A protein [Pseudomonadales bacterium]
MNPDLVSIIIPVYNAQKYLREAIDSVLGQSHLNIEIIAIDDGSVDGSADILRSYGKSIKWLSQSNSGAAAARNTGIAASAGAYVAFLDADDYWHTDKLKHQLSLLQSDPGLGYVFTLLKQFICPTLDAAAAAKLQCPTEPEPGYSSGTLLVHREVIDQVGLFDTQYRVGEFIDWHARARHQGIKNALLQEVTLYRRLHENNMGRNHDVSRKDFAKMARAALMRKKSAG